MPHPGPDTVVATHGDVPDDQRARARDKVDSLRRLVRTPILFARVDLTVHRDPARQFPALAKAELDLGGRMVRAHATARTLPDAIDRLEERLRARIGRSTGHDRSTHLRRRRDEAHRAEDREWQHGDASPPAPVAFPRPGDEREIVRHKTFASAPMTVDEAIEDLEALDHDFYLFTNLDTGTDNVVAPNGESYELFEPSGASSATRAVGPVEASKTRPTVMSVDQARELLDLGDRQFVFFLDGDRAGCVMYRRYDGNYGLIVSSRTAGARSHARKGRET